MDTKKITIAVLVGLALVLGVMAVKKPTVVTVPGEPLGNASPVVNVPAPVVNVQVPEQARPIVNVNVPAQKFGALSGPDLPYQYLCIGGICTYYHNVALATATTTPCSIQAPSSTSTLLYASLRITTATSTATTWTLAKATTAYATTTRITTNQFSLSSGVLGTMNYIASSTLSGVDNLDVIAPNNYVVWGVQGTTISDSTKLNGVCQAAFRVN